MMQRALSRVKYADDLLGLLHASRFGALPAPAESVSLSITFERPL